MRIVTATVTSLAIACGSSSEPRDNDNARVDTEQAQHAADDTPRPAPGMDLQGPIPLPDPADTPRAGTGKTTDLMSDRAIVKVSVPTPPLGGAVQFTFADDRRAWVTRIPDARQLPSVAYAHGKVYVSGGFESVSFYALGAETGKIQWAATALEDNGPTAAVIEGDDVLFNTESCTLFSLDAHSGKRNWYRYLGDPTLAQVAVTDGLVYAAYPGSTYHQQGQFLGAYKVKTGAPVWSRYVGTELLATPVIAGDSIYASTVGGDTYRIDHRTGRVKWKKRLRATTAPWIAGDELFVSRRVKGKEQQIVVSTETGAVVREHGVSSGAYASDVPSHLGDWKAVWAFEGSRPVVERGIRYVAMGSEIHASDATSGDHLWTRRYPGSADTRSLGSVALAGAALVVSSRDGKVFGLDVDTGFTLWSYDIGKPVAAEPIIAKGWLYAATVDGYVVALEVSDPTLDGWHMFGGNAQKNGPVPPPAAPPPIEGTSQPTQATMTTASGIPAAAAVDTAITKAQADLDKQAEIERKVEAERRRKRAIEEEKKRPHPVIIDPACKMSPLC